MNTLKRKTGLFLFKFPWIFKIIRSIYRKVLFLYNKLYVKLWKGPSPHHDYYLHVDPSIIKRKSSISSNKYRDLGKVLDGDWDIDLEDFQKDYPYYTSLKASLLDKQPWIETELYKVGLDKINSGQTAFSCKTEKELLKRFDSFKSLYHDIRDNGFRKPESDKIIDGTSDEVSVHISRNGEILFDDGGHRLAIAQLLNLKSIPIQVSIRHKDWDVFRRSLIIEAKDNDGLYQKVPHPDLDFIPAFHDCSERLQFIEPHLEIRSGKTLDIGANWAIFTHRLEELGFDCVAVEMDPIHLDFMEKLRSIFKRRFKIFKGNIFDFDPSDYGTFEVVLALNIFHHFIKTEALHNNLVQLLQNLKTNTIIFEPHDNAEFDGMGYFKNYNEEEFVSFIKEASGLKNSELIGRADDKRALYKIW